MTGIGQRGAAGYAQWPDCCETWLVMHNRIRMSLVAAALAMLFFRDFATHAQSTTIYVDANLGTTSCTNYSPEARACAGGSSTAYRTIASASSAANPGTLVTIRGGTYREALSPARSGTASAPIVFRRHGSETVTITGVDIGLTVISRQYVEIDGVTVTDVNGFARLQDSRDITIRNSSFRTANASGTTGSIKLVRSTFNRIADNRFENGNDNMVLVDAADRNVIEGNTFVNGRHSLLSVRCSNFNVFRGNSFSNANQKAIEIYDCEGVGSDSPIRYDAAHRNLFESNEIILTRSSSEDNDYNGIQHGAQQTIVRRNVFRNNQGGAVNYAEYANESRYVYGNRLYHNTFYSNRCYAIIGDFGTSNYRDQRVKNNLLYRNVDCGGGGAQVRIPDSNAVILTSNAIETSSPGFVNEAGNDFHLAAGSRMIDAASALTNTAAAGSGSRMIVQDASYFFGGHDIPGQVGDTIQLMGGSGVAVVVAIDYAANALTLDRSLTWSAGQGVALQFSGSAPDMGAFEAGAVTTPPAPQPPTNLRIIR